LIKRIQLAELSIFLFFILNYTFCLFMKFKYTDFHIHSKNWSIDVGKDGPNFEDYVRVAETNQINICFLEHYEIYYLEKDKTNPFYGDNINNYLEEIDKIKETYDFVLGGLEVEYYMDRDTELREFMDDYERELDFIAGTIHEWKFGYPVTTRKLLLELLERRSIKQVVDEYFTIFENMLNSKIFKNVCHIDTIFRYINNNDIKPPEGCDTSDERVIDLGRLCIKNKINIEYNLSGVRFPIGRSFPSKAVIIKLKEEGAGFFVGSDSHELDYFEEQIPKVKKAYSFIELE